MRTGGPRPADAGEGVANHLLDAPAPGQHIMQLYTAPEALTRAVSHYASEGLSRGEAVLLVARPGHLAAIIRRLTERGFALEELAQRGQLGVLDASRTLESLLVDGMPDRARFGSVIGGAVETAKAAGYLRCRAFGEMVDILRRTSLDAVLRLEELWGELLAAHGIALLCSYSIDNFAPQSYRRGLLQHLSGAHSHLMPVEDYARLDEAVGCAFAEVFGGGRDASLLRDAFLGAYRRPAAMPDAEAAILAAREFAPATAADLLLERARFYYESRARAA